MHIAEHRQAAFVQAQQAAMASIQAQGALAQATDTKSQQPKGKASSDSASEQAGTVKLEKGAIQVEMRLPAMKKTITAPGGKQYTVTEEPADDKEVVESE